MIKGLIFDFDGLILDTETAWYESYYEVLRSKYNYELKLEDFVKCVGADNSVLFKILKEDLGRDLDENGLFKEVQKKHQTIIQKKELREGIIGYLKEAKLLGLKTAVCTSSKNEWISKHLSDRKILNYFDYFITADDVERIKPYPDLFEKTIEDLEISKDDLLVFEDSLNGLLSANKAGLKTIIFYNPVTEHLDFSEAHQIYSNMSEIALGDLLKQF
ncbi:HAD family hydrolase [Mammaliicoccus sciuri]|uniref:HAD family hydrolase n=1 Tax=Mammaliicoccus sciuri TaxID=1296 RepID=UPI001E30E761|nr:HAD-IA family hydrolase [Mammaliicoccus sciuri]MCD8819096.1 HAD-IA family hydrolase [Mammaliicoccus sciuri]MCD8824081.1 HAD-IA family hydrolase [Mammaliicoccus sciuri]